MDDEPDNFPAVLGIASMLAAAAAWAPVIGFLIALGVGVADEDGFGCTLDTYGTRAAFASGAATVMFAIVASILALIALVRGARAPTAGGLASAIVGFSAATGALLASPMGLFFWGVFNDSLCWSRNIVIGRPLRVRSEPRFAMAASRTDWASGPAPRPIPDEVLRAELAAGWTAAGLGEHAAVAAFAKLVLDLVAHGAPPDLIRRSLEAALDEVRHAERAFAVASAYAGRPVGPGPLSDGAPTPLAALAAETWVDGVIGESVSADVLGELAERSADPVVAGVLREASGDERVHTALARDVVTWACKDRAAAAAVQAARAPSRPAVPPLVPGVDADALARRATERALVV